VIVNTFQSENCYRKEVVWNVGASVNIMRVMKGIWEFGRKNERKITLEMRRRG
jgi:hypothetical protein